MRALDKESRVPGLEHDSEHGHPTIPHGVIVSVYFSLTHPNVPPTTGKDDMNDWLVLGYA